MSDESDIGSSRDRRKRKTRYIEDSSDSDSSMDITRRKRRKHRLCIRESDSESDSSIEIVHKKRVGRVTSDDGASTSGSEIVRLKKTVTTLVSDSEAGHSTDSGSDSDWCTESETKKNSNTAEAKEASKHDSSESGDDQLEKCPICLLPFKSQEVGLPESCDHSFCIDCILEWSKSVNTCPVDRQVFNLILVKSHYNGKVIKQVPIQPAEQQVGINEIQDDPTFCEICGRCDREDRMLLCDGCDLGFHMECLNPPLNEIPAGLWFCLDCEPEGQETLMDIYEVYAESLTWHSRSRTRNPTRLVPRTRQSERVRTRVITHRSQRQRNTNEHRQGQRNVQSGSSNVTDRNRSTSGMRNRRRKRSKKPRIKITYEIDPVTGERIAIRTKIKRKNRKTRKQRERARMAAQAAKSVKGRLAAQLGILIPRSNGQHVIETRSVDNTNSIGYQRSQAGIPTLHLFGPRDDLDYFGDTDSEEEISSNANILIRRRPQSSDVSVFRRAARRKAIVAPVVQPQASTSVLDSILDIQAKFHSKNSVLSVNEDGSVKIDSKTGDLIDKSDRNNNTNKNRGKERGSRRNDNRRINLDNYASAYFRQTPMYGNGPSNPPATYSNVNNADFTRRDTAVDSGNTTVTTSSEQVLHGSTPGGSNEDGPSYSLQQVCSSFDYDSDKKEKDKDKSGDSSPGMHNSDSELDIYSDIETVSTSRAEEYDAKPPSPTAVLTPNTPTDDDANNSDVDLVIDTEKVDDSKEQVSSTVDLADRDLIPHSMLMPHLSIEGQNASLEIQNQTVQSSNSKLGNEKEDKDEEDDDDSEDGCPNFSIYSSESMNIAKTTEMQLRSGNVPDAVNTQASSMNSSSVIDEIDRNVGAITSAVIAGNGVHASVENRPTHPNHLDNTQLFSYSTSAKMQVGLYSDSEDESVVKITKIPDPKNDTAEEPENTDLVDAEFADDATTNDTTKDKKSALADISNMTEDISEEERSYTPCLDERTHKQGLEGLDTEMISDDDRNDFDESHELKAASEGDALEINAKESELDFTKPEDYEEGEIIDKLKNKKPLAEQKNQPQEKEKEPEKEKPPVETKEPEPTPASFKKLSKSNKERHYRDKDKENVRSKSREKKSDREIKKSRRREKRKDLERYNVRSIIAEKPRRVRDKFGRDENRKKSPSRSSKSLSPQAHRSLSRDRGRSHSRERVKKKKRVRSLTRSRTPPARRRSRSPRLRRQKSRDRSGDPYPPRERANSRERAASRERRKYRNRSRGPSISPRRRREWLQSSRCWSRSQSRSFTPEKRMTPSWTPPRLLESQSVKPQNLTVILNNDHNQKKKDKAKRINKKGPEKGKKRRRNRTPPPSKEVFASGNNILVSVSFNKDKNQRDVTNKRKRDVLDESVAKKQRKAKDKRGKPDAKRKKKRKDLSGVKPVAIIDLDRSPFREVTPAPEDVIVLTDSENAESNDMLGLQKAICDSSQQVASPERPMTANYLTGPKTPPEPQVKFTLNPKQTQLRAISNPLHEPDDIEEEIDPQEELEQRLNESMHKGPNTPPEPPNSPPSSPDAYDPFEPTKSRSPTPEPLPPVVQLSSTSQNDSVREESLIDSRNEDDDETIDQSHTPPAITDIQPADSQCSNMKPMSPEKSPEQHNIGVVINRVVQSQAAIFPTVTSKSISSSFSNGSMVTSSPMVPPRINILSSTVLTPTTIASALPQRIVLPNTTKSSPVKVSPNKLPIKSTPIKPMPAKSLITKSNKSARKSNNHTGNENYDALLDFDSPYSPGSSDYEDLFEPPTETAGAKQPTSKPSQSAQKSKDQNAFDVLFGASPVNNFFSKATTKSKGKTGNNNNIGKYKKGGKGTKQVGVKVDEDTLKILDELPNSAVEMQVKYKYLKKLNRQERVVEEVKLVLKPHYNKKHINKEEYKDILRRAVPKICHNKSGEINPQKIQNLIEAYVRKIRHSKKVTSSSSVNPQKA